ncbi:MAG: Rieske 2Fe-2S domain-containing protein, partial [Chloroflexi bacterium]
MPGFRRSPIGPGHRPRQANRTQPLPHLPPRSPPRPNQDRVAERPPGSTFPELPEPASGDPAVAVSLGSGSVVAFDAVCTHAGCQVGYDASQRLLSCPCH